MVNCQKLWNKIADYINVIKSFVVNPENIVRLDKELGVIYFENGESCLVSKAKQKEIVAKMLVPKNMAVWCI